MHADRAGGVALGSGVDSIMKRLRIPWREKVAGQVNNSGGKGGEWQREMEVKGDTKKGHRGGWTCGVY